MNINESEVLEFLNNYFKLIENDFKQSFLSEAEKVWNFLNENFDAAILQISKDKFENLTDSKKKKTSKSKEKGKEKKEKANLSPNKAEFTIDHITEINKSQEEDTVNSIDKNFSINENQEIPYALAVICVAKGSF